MRAHGDRLVVARSAALLALGALAVHQLRYLVAFGAGSGEALHREGHGYLLQALPVLVALASATLLATLVMGARERLNRRAAPRPPTPIAGVLYGLALLAIFGAQELAEGALAAGHPAGLEALVGSGAWVAAPLALGLGFAAALVERLLRRTEVALAARLDRSERPPLAPEPAAPVRSVRRAALAELTLAFGLARRPPPAAPLA